MISTLERNYIEDEEKKTNKTTLSFFCTYSLSAENWTLERAWKHREEKEVSNEAAFEEDVAEAQNSIWIWLILQAKEEL